MFYISNDYKFEKSWKMLDKGKKIIDWIRKKMVSSMDEPAEIIMDTLFNYNQDNRICNWLDENLPE
jgi:hypothetical protein